MANRKSDFLKAASVGDVSRLKKLALEIGNGEDLMKVVASDGSNALILAAANGKTLICKFLIDDFKFDINSRDRNGNTPLMAAIQKRKRKTAVYFIENGADLRCANDAGYGVLHAAAATGQTEIMRLLLSKFVPDLNTAKVHTPLQVACWKGRKEAVKLLLDYGADPNATLEFYGTPLMFCIASKSIECMELLLEADADPNIGASGRFPLISAACEGNIEMITLLLEAGANPNAVDSCDFKTPIEHAALRQDVESVKILFPVTSRLPSFSDWSVDGVIKGAYSMDKVNQMVATQKDYVEKAKAKGGEAFKRKEYMEAIEWYTKADRRSLIRADIISNRSLCWAKLKQGQKALEDAECCVALSPEWPKGHYRLGAARMLLNEYSKAVEAFAKALELDPENKDVKKAHREAVEADLAAKMSRSTVS